MWHIVLEDLHLGGEPQSNRGGAANKMETEGQETSGVRVAGAVRGDRGKHGWLGGASIGLERMNQGAGKLQSGG